MKKIINFILILTMVLFDTRYIVYSITSQNCHRLETYLALIPLLFIPTILKLFKVKISDSIETMYFIFIFLAQFLGCGVNLYAKISWFDTFTHLLSGTFFSIVSLYFLDKYKIKVKVNSLFFIIYVLGFTMLTASIWEFFEFAMDKIISSNLQHSIETGVTDTMVDMMAAFTGSILFLIGSNIKRILKK